MFILSELWELTLSQQQREILDALSNGQTQKEAAKTLGISQCTIKQQVHRIKGKRQRLIGVVGSNGADKNDTKSSTQFQSVLYETTVEDPQPASAREEEASELIPLLEATKNLKFTPLQKEISLMSSKGYGVKIIAAELGIASKEVESNLDQIRKELLRSKYENGPEVEYLGGSLTVNQAQVLASVKSMSVKRTSVELGKTWEATRKTMSRSGISAREIKKQRREGPRFRNNHYEAPDPEMISLMRSYFYGNLDTKRKISAELALRAAGMIRSVPTIMKTNGQFLNMMSVQKRKHVFHVTKKDESTLLSTPPGMKTSILEYAGASLIMINRYANEEEESEGTSFRHTYAVDKRFWPAIQSRMGSGVEPNSGDRKTESTQVEGLVSNGSQVHIRDTATEEIFRVSMPGAKSSPEEECFALSPEAPLARALCGSIEGATISIEVTKGIKIKYEVLKVQNG